MHKFQVHILVMRFDTKVVLEHFAAGCAHAGIVLIDRNVRCCDERSILKMAVDLIFWVGITVGRVAVG